MTAGDYIRNMDDVGLATLFHGLLSSYDHITIERLRAAGVNAELIEIPALSVANHLQMLQSPAEEIFNLRG